MLVHFFMLRDKMAILEAVKNHTPYQFKAVQLHFLQDLCRSAPNWRRSLQRVTQTLRTLGITATKDGRTCQLLSADEAAAFLQRLGLPQPASSNEGQKGIWDVTKIVAKWDVAKWGPSCTLTATKDGRTCKLLSVDEAAAFLQRLGLPQPASSYEGQKGIWDVAKIVPFIP
ncbi:Hypothetical predicted protein [Pelobates cultripes]|uniref:Uncharacterized protein n=1 Tax=Pelobates cultripes TaxID=61616 RepID=A0AAD1VJ94_PELCU|nr:Hypothetical predicted protein [Pelobates cultripes]